MADGDLEFLALHAREEQVVVFKTELLYKQVDLFHSSALFSREQVEDWFYPRHFVAVLVRASVKPVRGWTQRYGHHSCFLVDKPACL
jgi:hypothetical protein